MIVGKEVTNSVSTLVEAFTLNSMHSISKNAAVFSTLIVIEIFNWGP